MSHPSCARWGGRSDLLSMLLPWIRRGETSRDGAPGVVGQSLDKFQHVPNPCLFLLSRLFSIIFNLLWNLARHPVRSLCSRPPLLARRGNRLDLPGMLLPHQASQYFPSATILAVDVNFNRPFSGHSTRSFPAWV